ncbi:hypothetical protein Nepgr_020659 [Nepenthes gracilis]|uniref:protein-serine/threonine phosphatase n=1 Tax=Nepenthes gracilis TaxID=150966 RepID=A0AAD3SWL1_NEPGR|nr:hypothetical protein Nepgr_020659 [Nepenthes gracilis]
MADFNPRAKVMCLNLEVGRVQPPSQGHVFELGGGLVLIELLDLQLTGEGCLSNPSSAANSSPTLSIYDAKEEPKAKAMSAVVLGTIIGFLLVMLLSILLLIFLACKPWRFLSRFYCTRTIKADDVERLLIQEDLDQLPSQRSESAQNYAPEWYFQTDRNLNSHGAVSLTDKLRLPFPASHLALGSSLVLGIGDPTEDILVGQTLKRPFLTSHFIKEKRHNLKEDFHYNSKFPSDANFVDSICRNITDKGSCLTLVVISGPSCGLHYSLRSTSTSKLPVTLGRNSPCNLLLKDSEVSGKHAMITWSLNKLKWELVDMGSLNGTLLNSKAVHHPDFGSRNWGDPVELAGGDIITLGTTSQIHVQITSLTKYEVPFGVGIASDAMALRRGGKKLPMEDACYYQWPVPGADQFGVFGICDGHGGADAAKSASKILPEMIAAILSDPSRRKKVLSQQDASDVLREAFSQTEAFMNYYYEGCTATVLLLWADDCKSFCAQCANVGDSACVMDINGKQIKMTEDHRITSYSERQRIKESGDPLKDGDTRLCGLNLGRMLGDKFLKEQDSRFSSEPYISQVVYIDAASGANAILASDGLWDVINVKKAIQLVQKARERHTSDRKDLANKMAYILLNEARTLRTKDNTSIIYLDFDSAFRNSCKHSS